MYFPKTKCVYSRYEHVLNNGNIIFVQNAKHCFLSVKQPTCSVGGGGFSVFCCSCFGWFVFFESMKGPLFFLLCLQIMR